MPLTIVPFVSGLTKPKDKTQLLNQLRETGVQIREPDQPPIANERGGPIYIFLGSGGTENTVAQYLGQIPSISSVVLIAHHADNSLPAALEIKSWLQKQGIDSILIQDSLKKILSKLREWLGFSDTIASFSKRRIGLFGPPSDWLIGSEVNLESIEAQWGLKFTKESLQQILPENKSVEHNFTHNHFEEDANCCHVSNQSIKKAKTLAARILESIESKYDAISVRCFDILLETDVSGCYALSLLNDMGFVAGCEGDIPSTFTMLLIKELLGKASFMGNVVSIDEEENTIGLAHCTVPLSLTSEYEITTHYESGKSVAIRGNFEKQRVTIFKVGGRSLEECWVSAGRIVDIPRNRRACRTQVDVRLDRPVKYFLENPLGNHHVMVKGDHSELIDSFMSFATRGY